MTDVLGGYEGVIRRKTESVRESDVSARARKHAAGRWQQDLETSVYGERDWTIPGQGDRPESCGSYYPRQFCDEAGHLEFGASQCQRRSCPQCDAAWSATRAAAVAERLGAYRHTLPDSLERRAVHATISPPPGSIQSKGDVERLKKKAYDLAKEHGVTGGVAVFHGFRITEEALEVAEAERDLGRHDYGVWKWVREHERHWRDLTYWSPHVHVIGVAPDFEAAEDRADGYVVRNIRSLSAFRIGEEDGYQDMIGATRYILSHATFDSSKSGQCVRWFGELAPAAFSPEGELTRTALRRIQETVERLLGQSDRGEDGAPAEDDERESCPCDGCEGELWSIFDAQDFLQREDWCEHVGAEAQHRVKTAFKWQIGELQPPPGLRAPHRTEQKAKDALDHLL